MWGMQLGDVGKDIEEAVEMSVVEAQTLFAAQLPEHAVSPDRVRRVARRCAPFRAVPAIYRHFRPRRQIGNYLSLYVPVSKENCREQPGLMGCVTH